jgi:hypothetical protein
MTIKPQFITDDEGHRTGVILSIAEFNQLLEEFDETTTVQLYDQAKAEPLTFRPMADALKDIRAKRANGHV